MSAENHPASKYNSTVILTQRFGDRHAANATHDGDAEATAIDRLEPGARLDRYLIVHQVGGGGMGVVYRAQDTELNRPVALKVLPLHLCRRSEYLNRFLAEAQAQARLNSPHVVTLYSLMKVPAGEVLVLEYVDGQTLQQFIRSRGRLTPQEALAIFDQALTGVAHIHRMGVVHRDLKPSNIFITRDGVVKIIDFGISALVEENRGEPQNAMVGTLLYIPPEQINGRYADFRADIYTLGISLYEAVTGRLPFERRTNYALIHAHVQENPPSPTRFYRQVPHALERVILKAIAKEPDRRFQSATEFRAALVKLDMRERGGEPLPLAAALSEYSAAMPSLAESFDNRAPRTRWLTGLRLDLALAAVACFFVIGLGLAPFFDDPRMKAPASPAVAQTKPVVAAKKRPKAVRVAAKPARTVTRRPAARPKTTSVIQAAPPPAEPKPSKPKPAKLKPDKYNALKNAWGG